MRPVRALLVAVALLLAGCASMGGLPRQPFADIPVPAKWIPYSDQWVMIRSPQVTAAKLVYFAEAPVDATLGEARALLLQNGWVEKGSERFVNREGFRGVRADFAKGEDICRVTAIEGANATHADVTVARRN